MPGAAGRSRTRERCSASCSRLDSVTLDGHSTTASPARCRTACMPGRPARSRTSPAGSRPTIVLANARTGQAANAKSVLGIVGLDIRHGDPCRLTVAGGRRSSEAIAALSRFIEHDFPTCDDDAAGRGARAGERRRCRACCAQAGADGHAGHALSSPGIGSGPRVRSGRRSRVPDSIPLGRRRRTPTRRLARIERGARAAARAATTRASRGRGAASRRMCCGRTARWRAIPSSPAHLAAAIARARGRRRRARVRRGRERTSPRCWRPPGARCCASARSTSATCACSCCARSTARPRRAARRSLAEDSVCIADTLTPGQFLALDARRLQGPRPRPRRDDVAHGHPRALARRPDARGRGRARRRRPARAARSSWTRTWACW